MTITLPPAAPSRNRPAAFSAEMDDYLAWLTAAIPQINEIATGSVDSGVYNAIVVSTSLTLPGSSLFNSTTARFGVPITGAAVKSFAGFATTVGGTANAITLTMGTTGALLTGQTLFFVPTATNTTGVTINLDGIGVKTCLTVTGAALPAGYLVAGEPTRIYYVSPNWIVDREPEYGSNGNGEYWRFANGYQVCTKTMTGQGPVSTAAGGGFASGNISPGTWAAAFAVKPAVAAVAHSAANAHAWWGQVQIPTTTVGGVGTLMRFATSAATDFVIDFTVTGRWY